MPRVEVEDRKAAAALSKRIEALEKEMAELKQKLQAMSEAPRVTPGPNDWRKTVGMFKDDPTYDEAVKLGRAWRRRQPKC